jgi:prepilin-type N-terminal cleavage/methylation domain-containing protein
MRKNRGFSLLEMLVVMGIIAVLVGILLPIFAKTEQRAKLVRWGEFSNSIKGDDSLVLYYNFNGDQGSPIVRNQVVPGNGGLSNARRLDGNLGLYRNKALTIIEEPLHVPGAYEGDATLGEVWGASGRFPGKPALSFSPYGSTPTRPYCLALSPGAGTGELARLLANQAGGKQEQQFTIAFWINATPGLGAGLINSDGRYGSAFVNWDTGGEDSQGSYVIRIRSYGSYQPNHTKMRFQVRDLSEASYDVINDPRNLIDGPWEFWAFTFHFLRNTPGLPAHTFASYTRIFLNNRLADEKKDVGNQVPVDGNSSIDTPLEGLSTGGPLPLSPPLANQKNPDGYLRDYLCFFYGKKGGSTAYAFWGQCDELAFWDKDLSYDPNDPDSNTVTSNPTENVLSQMYRSGMP